MRYIKIEDLLVFRSRWGQGDTLWKNSVLKKDFRDFFHNKCWYTEVLLVGQDVHIDHFRPKAAVKPFENFKYNHLIQDKGYYWLANDPSNYRACCIYANRKTGGGGKGNYFPLADDGVYQSEKDENNEHPKLKIYWSSETMQEVVAGFSVDTSRQKSLAIIKEKLKQDKNT